MASDHQFLIGRYHVNGHTALRCRDHVSGCAIGRAIELCPKPTKSLDDTHADHRRVLAYPSGENEGIEPTERGRKHARLECDPVDEIVDGKGSTWGRTRQKLAHVVAHARNT